MKHDRCITIDLHGMTVSEARKRIQQLLKTCPQDTVQIEIIHGCNSGQALQKFVRRELKHPRILRKSFGLNGGSTTLILQESALSLW